MAQIEDQMGLCKRGVELRLIYKSVNFNMSRQIKTVDTLLNVGWVPDLPHDIEPKRNFILEARESIENLVETAIGADIAELDKAQWSFSGPLCL